MCVGYTAAFAYVHHACDESSESAVACYDLFNGVTFTLVRLQAVGEGSQAFRQVLGNARTCWRNEMDRSRRRNFLAEGGAPYVAGNPTHRVSCLISAREIASLNAVSTVKRMLAHTTTNKMGPDGSPRFPRWWIVGTRDWIGMVGYAIDDDDDANNICIPQNF